MSAIDSTQGVDYQPCICEKLFCGDDLAERVNNWIIAGRLFITLGAIALIVGSMAHAGAIGLTLATAEFLIGAGSLIMIPGAFCIHKGNSIERQRLASIQNILPGIGNAGSNCCINSFIQFARHIPTLRDFFRSHHIWRWFYTFRTFIDQIESDERNNIGITSADSQSLRRALSGMTRGVINPSSSSQEDPDEFLGLIRARMSDRTRGFSEVTETQYYRNKDSEVTSCTPSKTKDWGTVKLPIERWDSLQKMFTKSFDRRPNGAETVTKEEAVDPTWWQRAWHNRTETQLQQVKYSLVRETKKYKTAPKDLFVSLKRFNNSGGKISRGVTVEKTLKVDAKFTEDNQEANYEIDTFIRHIGWAASSGHYMSYAKRGDDWYEFNDTIVRKITTNELNEALKESYIYHYTKVSG